MNKQINEMACKNCIHYQKCVDTFRKGKQDGEYLLIEEDAYFAYADDCDFYADKRIYRKQSEGENISQMHPSDEFICEKCSLIIRDCCRYEIDPDDGDETCYEFTYQFCPRCGMKVKGDEGK